MVVWTSATEASDIWGKANRMTANKTFASLQMMPYFYLPQICRSFGWRETFSHFIFFFTKTLTFFSQDSSHARHANANGFFSHFNVHDAYNSSICEQLHSSYSVAYELNSV